MSVNIINWSGRLGNNICQIVNAILFAHYNNIEIITFPKHVYFKQNCIDLNKYDLNNNKNNEKNKIFNDIFFSRNKICKKYNLNITIFENKKINISEILKDLINLAEYKNIDITDNDLTIHIRSGDVYQSNTHSGWIQPPLCFYENIIKERVWNKIFLICEDNKSPVIKPLICKYSNIVFKIQKLQQDINIIIQSKNICFGMGSFIPALLLLNNNLNTIYYPKYCYRYIIDLISYKEKKEYELLNYIQIGEWKNTNEQIDIMLNYTI